MTNEELKQLVKKLFLKDPTIATCVEDYKSIIWIIDSYNIELLLNDSDEIYIYISKIINDRTFTIISNKLDYNSKDFLTTKLDILNIIENYNSELYKTLNNLIDTSDPRDKLLDTPSYE